MSSECLTIHHNTRRHFGRHDPHGRHNRCHSTGRPDNTSPHSLERCRRDGRSHHHNGRCDHLDSPTFLPEVVNLRKTIHVTLRKLHARGDRCEMDSVVVRDLPNSLRGRYTRVEIER